jgi:hypothetical protein
MSTFAFLLAEQRCHTAVSLHRVIQSAVGVRQSSLRSIRAELKVLLMQGDVVQVSNHYYCAREALTAAQDWHVEQLCRELRTRGACTWKTLIQTLGLDARFLGWVVACAGNRIEQGEHEGKPFFQLGRACQHPVLLSPHVLDTVRERLRVEHKANATTVTLGRLTQGLRQLVNMTQDVVLQYVRELETLGEVSVRAFNQHTLLVESLPALLFPAPVVTPVVALPAVVGLPLVTPMPARPAPTRHQQVLLTAALGRPQRTLPQGVSAPVVTPFFPEADVALVMDAANVQPICSSVVTPLVSVTLWGVRTLSGVAGCLELERPQARGTPGLCPRHPQPIHDAA